MDDQSFVSVATDNVTGAIVLIVEQNGECMVTELSRDAARDIGEQLRLLAGRAPEASLN